ncbi:5'-3' exonuclease PLD3 isoform X2 [Trematomus bernacchii]|uniref:5'-3' exonuclease PLD3 isoform X2 n=1 Tax=Trematomus bernacchii TaxID=40690 RepID=UPI00146D23AD|nr:5'-3' exonuclease PLD3 isoform X2 [Trematomus bernacchii]
MPMVLRARKSLAPTKVSEEEESEEESQDTAPVTRRKSARPHGSTTYEESDESDSESVQIIRMEETLQSTPAELEEETAEEAHLTELKYCSVVLDRIGAEDKASGELEEREDMNRKGGKLVSRIPTFQKRPSGAIPTPELHLPKKDPPVHVAQPLEKSGSGGAEALKSKLTEIREKALPLPSVQTPKISFEAEPSTTFAHSPVITTPKSLYESGQYSSMIVSPRPALRLQQGSEQHLPEEDQSQTLEKGADNVLDAPDSQLPDQGPIGQKPLGDTKEKYDVAVESWITLTAYGDTKQSEDELHTTKVSDVAAIMDEQPPWEIQLKNPLEFKDSKSSSEAECHTEKSFNVDEATSPAAPEKPAASTKSTKSSGRCSFALFCFLPTLLLLVGGLGQHVWHYGLPLSVAQLTAQMELHWMEGLLVPESCSTDCRVRLVESIPEGLYPYSPPSRRSIADSWLHLLDKANSSVDIAAFYFSLRGSEDPDATDSQGRMVFEKLKQLESKGVKLQVAVNAPQTSTKDTAELAATGAEVREVDLKAVTGGIVHTKLLVVDQKHFYLGSANMDWRSLSQVKEVGLWVEDCSCLAQDAFRIFGVYRSIGGLNNGSLPPYWPARFSALSSSQNPLHLMFNGVPAQVYLSSAPPQISARGRSDDLSTILSVIDDAHTFIHISVMDYLPLSQFSEPLRYWPAIDSALRSAACTRGVQVRLLVSCWKHSPSAMFPFLQSLLLLNRPPLKCNVDVKIFTVPSTAKQMKIPFARVNHAKYMVTDRVVYIGTSNWSEDYFTQTAGVGLVVNQTGSEVKEGQETLQAQAEELFLRDWLSDYARSLYVDDLDVCRH